MLESPEPADSVGRSNKSFAGKNVYYFDWGRYPARTNNDKMSYSKHLNTLITTVLKPEPFDGCLIQLLLIESSTVEPKTKNTFIWLLKIIVSRIASRLYSDRFSINWHTTDWRLRMQIESSDNFQIVELLFFQKFTSCP